jgi:hypothetical protein
MTEQATAVAEAPSSARSAVKSPEDVCKELPVYESHAGGLIVAVQIPEPRADGTTHYRNRPHIKFEKRGLRGPGILVITPTLVRQCDFPGKTFADKAKALVDYLEGHQTDPDCRFVDPSKEGETASPGDPGTYWRRSDRAEEEMDEHLEGIRKSLAQWPAARLKEQLKKLKQPVPVKGEKEGDDTYNVRLQEAVFAVYNPKAAAASEATGTSVVRGPQVR